MSVAEHADDAAALLEALKATSAVVIARSYGGEVATDLALRYPKQVRALVLLQAAPVSLLPAAADWTRALRDRLRAVAQQAGADAVGEALIGELGAAWSSLPKHVRRIFTHNGPAVLADLEGSWLQAGPATLATIHQPVLLVAATDSPPQLRDPNSRLEENCRSSRRASARRGRPAQRSPAGGSGGVCPLPVPLARVALETICGATVVFDHEGEPDLIENELTGGAYRVMVGRAPAGEGPPPHIHPHTDEGFYIGEGEMTFVLGDREVVAGPGSFVFVASGVEHTAHITKPLRGC